MLKKAPNLLTKWKKTPGKKGSGDPTLARGTKKRGKNQGKTPPKIKIKKELGPFPKKEEGEGPK